MSKDTKNQLGYRQLSAKICAKYERLSCFNGATKQKRRPRKGTIYIGDKPIVVGATITWIFGRPCWKHPALPVSPSLIDNNDGTFTLPSYDPPS